jgi:hypothetical protein
MPFGKRYTPIVASDGSRLLLYGGQRWEPYDWCAFLPECVAFGLNDVWQSGDGVAWTIMPSAAPWSGRGLIHGSMYFRGRHYLVGGGLKLAPPGATLSETVEEYADVWSSDDGVQWKLEATSAGFSPRTHHSVLATDRGCYVVGGSVGSQLATTNEVYFAYDCIRYQRLVSCPVNSWH